MNELEQKKMVCVFIFLFFVDLQIYEQLSPLKIVVLLIE